MAFNFGGGAGQQPTTTSTGFSLGGATAGGQTGFNFGGAPRPPAFGQQTTTAAGGGLGGFSLSGAATTTAPAAGSTPGFNFGMAAASKPSATGFSFGATQPASTAATGFSMGQTTAATTPATGFGLGAPSASSTPAATTSATPSLSTGFSGFGLPSSTSATSAAPTSTGQSALSGLLSGSSSTTPATTAQTSLGGATSTGFGFGAPPASTAASTSASTGYNFGAPATTSTQGTFNLPSFSSATSSGASTLATSTGIGLSTAGALSTTGTGGSQKQMTYRQLEEVINKWTTELEEQEKYFLDQATQVNAWDKIVMENGEKIIQLNQDVEKVKMDQQKLDHELDFVHSQQRELEELLIPLEKPLDNMPPISYQQHADVEREHTYMLAESLDAQLKRMGQDLKEIIERLNSNNSKPEEDDPVQQITKILNAHVVSLMWVDRNTASLQKRIEDISRQMEVEKREQERNFRLAYS